MEDGRRRKEEKYDFVALRQVKSVLRLNIDREEAVEG